MMNSLNGHNGLDSSHLAVSISFLCPERLLFKFRLVDFAPAAKGCHSTNVLESNACFGLGAVIRCKIDQRQPWAVHYDKGDCQNFTALLNSAS
jgi:hypothetical protein